MLDASLDGADLNRFAPSKEIKYDKFRHHACGVLMRTHIGSLMVLEFLQTLLVMAFGWICRWVFRNDSERLLRRVEGDDVGVLGLSFPLR